MSCAGVYSTKESLRDCRKPRLAEDTSDPACAWNGPNVVCRYLSIYRYLASMAGRTVCEVVKPTEACRRKHLTTLQQFTVKMTPVNQQGGTSVLFMGYVPVMLWVMLACLTEALTL